jgi:hypothetical protein
VLRGLWVDPDPVVADGEDDPTSLEPGRGLDRRSVWRVLDRVVHQLDDDVAETVAVGPHGREIRWHVDPAPSVEAELLGGFEGDRSKVDE